MTLYITAEAQEKAELRKALRERLAACPHQEKASRDSCLTQQFLQLKQVLDAKTVLIYCGVGIEPDTRPLTQALWEMGKTVAMPCCRPERRMEARAVSRWEELVPGKLGIPEPNGNCPLIAKGELDFILVPALACDREGYRLGQGGGYYDRYLADYYGETAILCPAAALVDRLPREVHDLPVSIVITEEGSFAIGAKDVHD